MAEAVKAKNGKKMVKVKLPKLRGEKDQDVFVAVNGEEYLIKRGYEVEIPDYIYEAFLISERMKDEAEDYKEEAQKTETK